MQTEDRFEAKVQRVPESGCWLWTASCNSKGYGKFWAGGRLVSAHRHSYEQAKGVIPLGTELDHLCRVVSCVNPDHLEAVSHGVNVLRGVAPEATRRMHAAVAHCPQGHPYTEDNIAPQMLRGRWLARKCKTCNRVRALARYHAKGGRRAA